MLEFCVIGFVVCVALFIYNYKKISEKWNKPKSSRPFPPPSPPKRPQLRGGYIGNTYSTPLTGNTYYDNDEEYRRQSSNLDMMNTISSTSTTKTTW